MDKMLQNIFLVFIAVFVLFLAVYDIRLAWVAATVALLFYWGNNKMLEKSAGAKRVSTKKSPAKRTSKKTTKTKKRK